MSTPSRLVLVAALLACAAGVGYCASGKKGRIVSIARHPSEVRGCAFLGRVSGPDSGETGLGEGSLTQKVAELGGNVLLVLPGGVGEAWSCEKAVRVFAPPANPTRPRPIVGAAPTPAATPRT